jgi:bifunctional NMN adenylyltransferase/nudix hydrolase
MSKTQKPNVGVVVGRFQVPRLHEGHLELLNLVQSECTKVIVVLGSSHPINTCRDPLDFRSRELMIRTLYPDFTVVSIKDRRDDAMWSASLDGIINSMINPHDRVLLYGGRDSFIKHYSGQYPTKELEPSVYYSGTQTREELWDKSINSVEFRSGVVWAAYNRFPTTFPTVDIAIFNSENTQIILGAKRDDAADKLWRLPGGFVDVTDKDFVSAAKREVKEELGLEVGDYQYVADMKVDDWRYRDQIDAKIHTILFKAKHIFGSPNPGDDLYLAKWFDFNEDLLKENFLVPAHVPLIKKLLNI